ncbi:MAG: MerR family transcriptional regulator [Thiogranum sp.]|nr:MerR family transcriptional regulator [Thiogranum sp.]
MMQIDTSGDASTAAGLYPIRTVSSLTGVNPITLRAWERRYNLICPQRTAKGHRLYTQDDVERIQRAVALLNQGISISQLKPLIDAAVPPARLEAGDSDAWQHYRSRMLDALQRFDETALDTAYNDALSLYPLELVTRHLVTPLLNHLGEHWQAHPAGIAEEHFFSVYLRNKIGARLHHLNAQQRGPQLLISCLPGEHHEAGVLLFALAAVSHGYRTLTLGTNLPLHQIPPVLLQQHCDAVVLSGSTAPASGLFDEQLPRLVKSIGIPVFVGGQISEPHCEAITAAGAIVLGQVFAPALDRIAEQLAANRQR